jgi:hypothetical protein
MIRHSRYGSRQSLGFVAPKRRTKTPILNRRKLNVMQREEARAKLWSLPVRRKFKNSSRPVPGRHESGPGPRTGPSLLKAKIGMRTLQIPGIQKTEKSGINSTANRAKTPGERLACPPRFQETRWSRKAKSPPAPAGYRKILYREQSINTQPMLDLGRVRFNRKHVPRAPIGRWPIRSNGRRRWPSYPTTTEVLQGGPEVLGPSSKLCYVDSTISRRGMVFTDQRIFSNILGVRADVEVPLRYLMFFEHRWDMLILARRESFPKDFKRFLISLWRRRRHSLWLRRPAHLVSFVRSLTDKGRPESVLWHPPRKS